MRQQTVHNLRQYALYMEEMRKAIREGRFAEFRAAVAANYRVICTEHENGEEET